MKLKVLFLMTFFAVINLSAQGNRFIYEYQSRRDSTRTDSLKKEFVNLDVLPAKSYFYGQVKFATLPTIFLLPNSELRLPAITASVQRFWTGILTML